MGHFEFWERQHKARSKDEPIEPTDFAQEAVEIMSKKRKRILEIGCAAGRDSLHFAQKGHIITGIDVSPTAIEIAESNAFLYDIQNLTQFITADVSKVVMPKNAFDSIYARMSLQYFDDATLSKIIKQLNKTLSIDGRIFAQFRSVLDKKCGNGIQTEMDTFIDLEGHLRRFFAKASIKELFSNFKINHLSYETSRYDTAIGFRQTPLLTLIATRQ